MSGKFEWRPAMDRMLAFLRLHPKGSHAVVIDDISLFARHLQAHIKLRETLADAGGVLESPSIEFGEDSDSRLVEHMLASVAQHQREKNAEQTRNRMKGRMMNGYAVFPAPIHYTYKRTGSHGILLTRDEPIASFLQEALEGYASGRFVTKAEVKHFLEAQPEYPKCLPNGHIRDQRIQNIMSRVTYAGYIEHAPWGVSRRKGHHEPIISLETYEKMQARMTIKAMAPRRKDISEDFPPRRAVECASYRNPLTSCWSKSKTGKKYPYFWCNKRGCSEYRKNIRSEKVDSAFETLMKNLTPSRQLLDIATAMLKDATAQHATRAVEKKADWKRKIAEMEKQQDAALERLVDTTNEKVAKALETKISRLEDEMLLSKEKMANCTKTRQPASREFELLRKFLSNPWNIYKNGSLNMKKTVLRIAFKAPLSYDRESGSRTPQVSVIY